MKKKVLFVTYKLQNYRIPILNIIGNQPDIQLTVAHSAKKFDDDKNSFTELHLNFKKIGPFSYYDSTFKNLIAEQDVVVCMFYLQNLSFFKLVLSKKRKFKLIFWGIGVRASYDSEFDAPTVMNKVRDYWARRSDAMIFYTQYVKEKYIEKGHPSDKLFVMANTVQVNTYKESSDLRKNLLFVGTLYKVKKIFELLTAYNQAKTLTDKLPKLHIVGNGAEYDSIAEWINQTDNENNIFLHGAIYDEAVLAKMFTSSIACLSPGQAGLSVLKSFGYGVPFITHKDAITGGERLNIVDGKNGILFEEDSQLTHILTDIAENREKYLTMGRNAKEFYNSERTPENMANGFIDAVHYTCK